MTIRTSSCVIPIPNRPTDWLIVDTNQVRVTHLAKRSSSSEASIVNLPITVTVTVTLCNRCYCNWVSLVIDDCFYGCLCTVGFSSSEVQYFVPLKLLCFMSSLSASLFSGSLGDRWSVIDRWGWSIRTMNEDWRLPKKIPLLTVVANAAPTRRQK